MKMIKMDTLSPIFPLSPIFRVMTKMLLNPVRLICFNQTPCVNSAVHERLVKQGRTEWIFEGTSKSSLIRD